MVSESHIDLSSISESDGERLDRQLTKILKSSHFKSAQQMQRFLTYIIEIALFGKGETLKQYTIAVEALGYPEDFDADSNPLVRILGGRVRGRLNKYYDNEGRDDPLIISIPKGSYLPIIEENLVSPTLIKNESKESQGPKLGIFCFKDNALGSESNALLSQISSTIAKELSHFIFSKLYVQIPYLGEARSDLICKDAKKKFNVDFTLLLFIQNLPQGKVELFYRLWDNKSEEVISSDFFDVVAGQPDNEKRFILNKISTVVADIFQGKLHIHWSRALLRDEPTIPEKYRVLAYYRHYVDSFGRDAFKKAVSYCQKALDRDSNDIVANVIFADYCRRDYVYSFNIIEDALGRGKRSAERAISLKPDSHEAHYAMAQILFCLNEWGQSIGQFNLAMDISKNHAVTEYGTGFHFCLMGRWEEGLSLVRKAMALSGTYPAWFNITPFLYHYIREDYKEALTEALKIIVPNLMHGPLARCACYAQLGEKVKAKEELDNLLIWCPKFMEDGPEILKRFLGSKELAEKLWGGVIKAQG